jgi:proteasome lid subunit RPN8/RPN11
VITDLMLIPGTSAGRRHANLTLWMLPSDMTAVGTAHSHPSGALFPSGADLQLFRNWGIRHIILGRPFGPRDWRAYDGTGAEVTLTVVSDGPLPPR